MFYGTPKFITVFTRTIPWSVRGHSDSSHAALKESGAPKSPKWPLLMKFSY